MPSIECNDLTHLKFLLASHTGAASNMPSRRPPTPLSCLTGRLEIWGAGGPPALCLPPVGGRVVAFRVLFRRYIMANKGAAILPPRSAA
jgi:hypothetical protein